jgi:hypothetical protein
MLDWLNRTPETPYLVGDVFRHENGHEIVLINPNIGTAYYKDGKNNVAFLYAMTPEKAFSLGFKPVQEWIEEYNKIKEWGLFAPRQCNDGTWCALTPLYATTAICADYDEINPFVSRYCFEDSSYQSRTDNALYWLTRFETSMSLPIGNVAYRGHLGNEPIEHEIMTKDYYLTLKKLKYNREQFDISINDYSKSFMDEINTVAIQYGFNLLNDREKPYSPYCDSFGV